MGIGVVGGEPGGEERGRPNGRERSNESYAERSLTVAAIDI
jgi:hypothetical protein